MGDYKLEVGTQFFHEVKCHHGTEFLTVVDGSQVLSYTKFLVEVKDNDLFHVFSLASDVA